MEEGICSQRDPQSSEYAPSPAIAHALYASGGHSSQGSSKGYTLDVK